MSNSVNHMETGHISLIFDHILLCSKVAITEAPLKRNQLKEKLVVSIKGNVYLY